MPIVRIDPPPRGGNSPFGALQRIGAFFANPVAAIAGTVQETAQSRVGKKQGRFFPTELDTETGQVTIEVPKRGRGLIGSRAGRLAPKFAAIEQQLESSIAGGEVVPALRGAYRELATLLIEQAALFPKEATDMATGIIPPGGFAGFAQMTPASRLALGGGKAAKRRSKKKAQRTRNAAKKKRKVARNAKRRAKRAGKKKLVKGSPAAKAFMARLRAKRK